MDTFLEKVLPKLFRIFSKYIQSLLFVLWCIWKIWPPGSLEEEVQNLVKCWEVENINKVLPEDFKIMDPNKVTFSLNGINLQSKTQYFKMAFLNN